MQTKQCQHHMITLMYGKNKQTLAQVESGKYNMDGRGWKEKKCKKGDFHI